MPRIRRLIPGLAGLALAAAVPIAMPAFGQESGGLQLDAAGLELANAGLAVQSLRPPPPPGIAYDAVPAGAVGRRGHADRHAANRTAVARIRGDAGYLDGFRQGSPLAFSRQPPPPPFEPTITFIEAPLIVNSFSSTVEIGLDRGTVALDGVDAELPEDHPATGDAANASRGGVLAITNVESTVNMAVGRGNTAQQTISAAQ
ncbi:MAG TPA: hypothetical protein VK943_15415 [Arenibaculum sp.]|nr:hypothetical protein [Arenibaculum sp.]